MESLLPTYFRNAQRETDARWYVGANAQILSDARDLGIAPDTYAGIVAALSPRVSWDTARGRTPNLDLARALVTTGRAPALGANVAKALEILRGGTPAEILTGPKTRAFYLNLTRPGETDAVTLDRHMAAALGIRQDSLRGKGYERAAEFVRSEAAQVNLNPDQFQAAVWAQHRRETAR